jgi:translation initiation factor 2 subunit 1
VVWSRTPIRRAGIILLSNLSRKRIRSVNKHVRVGKIEVLQVLRVDAEKGYIDLSKKLLQAGDVQMCQERYKKSRTVHSIMIRLAILTETPVKKLYEQFGWPLYKKYGHAYDGFKKIIADTSILDEFNLEEKVRKATLDMINKRLAVRSVKVQSDIEVTCFTPEGVLAIKPSLRAGLEVCEDEGVQVHVWVVRDLSPFSFFGLLFRLYCFSI